ncbi:MAG: hypothetical protein M1833_004990 [Piccolia ochrophora]|nr:MAG: hypothetical protein M1833_004990 [Piccolia ochrophora]
MSQHLAYFIRTHEKALANAFHVQRQAPKHAQPTTSTSVPGKASGQHTAANNTETQHQTSKALPSASTALATALSLPSFSFTSHKIKPAKLSLTPHHLFYLLSRFEELSIPVGPMNVRVEDIHTDSSPANYVSFLGQSQRSKSRPSDLDSLHSVSSVRSVMSGMASFWSTFGLGSSKLTGKNEKTKAAIQTDLKYLYSAFTKIPCLRLAPDRKARLIAGYEEFPFDTAVPLWAFKNASTLELCDIDIRQFFGWDRLADQLRSLTVRRAGVENPMDLLISIVLDDMDKRRRRSSKTQPSPVMAWSAPSPSISRGDLPRSYSAPESPKFPLDRFNPSLSPQTSVMLTEGFEGSPQHSRPIPRSRSPSQPSPSRIGSAHGHLRSGGRRMKRSGSASSQSSTHSSVLIQSGSSSNLLAMGLPSSKWRFLRHLSLADNSLTSVSAASITPLANTLHSLDLSSNLLCQIPDSLATLTSLRALNLSNCMIDTLHSLVRNPLPAITALNLRANRLSSIAGVERLLSLERLDLRENRIADPTELARLTAIPDMREVWVTGNPFTRTHSHYRVTIFNLFRTSAGYLEDIVIDSAGPTYGEKKQLADRIAEPLHIPIVKPLPEDSRTSATARSPRVTIKNSDQFPRHVEQVVERPLPRPAKSEGSYGPNRRRKGQRRRIVELSKDASMPDQLVLQADPDRHQVLENVDSGTPTHALPPLNTTSVPSAPSDTDSSSKTLPAKDPQDWNVNGEIYKKKIEALRNEVGNGWLSVLGEDGWDGQKHHALANSPGDFSPASTIRPSPTTPRAGSQSILSGGRTLG